MLKTLGICQCNCCGKVVLAKPIGSQHNQTLYGPPDGWEVDENDEKAHLCPTCIDLRLNKSTFKAGTSKRPKTGHEN